MEAQNFIKSSISFLTNINRGFNNIIGQPASNILKTSKDLTKNIREYNLINTISKAKKDLDKHRSNINTTYTINFEIAPAILKGNLKRLIIINIHEIAHNLPAAIIFLPAKIYIDCLLFSLKNLNRAQQHFFKQQHPQSEITYNTPYPPFTPPLIRQQ